MQDQRQFDSCIPAFHIVLFFSSAARIPNISNTKHTRNVFFLWLVRFVVSSRFGEELVAEFWRQGKRLHLGFDRFADLLNFVLAQPP